MQTGEADKTAVRGMTKRKKCGNKNLKAETKTKPKFSAGGCCLIGGKMFLEIAAPLWKSQMAFPVYSCLLLFLSLFLLGVGDS